MLALSRFALQDVAPGVTAADGSNDSGNLRTGRGHWAMLRTADLVGAIVAVLFYVSAILVFSARLAGAAGIDHWIGYFEFLLAISLVCLLAAAPALGRAWLYYLQVGLMLAWLLAEALLDYIFKVDFRHTRWMAIGYVVLFFAGTGGMLGVAAHAGPGWSSAAALLFLAMAVLAFVQRAVTGR